MDCVTCKENGITSVATRIVNGRGYCDPCLRNSGKLEQVAPADPLKELNEAREEEDFPLGDSVEQAKDKRRKERAMSGNVDWGLVQKLRNEGASVAQLADKFGVSGPTVYAHTKAPNGQPKAAAAPAAQRTVAAPSRNGGSEATDWKAIREELQGKRDAINQMIDLIDEHFLG